MAKGLSQIKALRERENMSQELLALMLGCDVNVVRMFEAGIAMPLVDTANAIARILRADVMELGTMKELEEIVKIDKSAYAYASAERLQKNKRWLKGRIDEMDADQMSMLCDAYNQTALLSLPKDYALNDSALTRLTLTGREFTYNILLDMKSYVGDAGRITLLLEKDTQSAGDKDTKTDKQ